MRRRTKPRVAWFPKDPDFTRAIVNGLGERSNVISITLGLTGPINNTITGVVPVVFDQQHFPEGSGGVNSLADIESSGYRLRRIVGKCFVAAGQNPDITAPRTFICGAGFIVLRTDAAGAAQNTSLDSYNIFDIDNDDSPWIWKREWMLCNAQATAEEDPVVNDYPFTNAEYGSVADGPHIDQKTARIIGKDERLFLVVSAMTLDVGGEGVNGSTDINFTITPRVLGSMKPSLGNRNNASR